MDILLEERRSGKPMQTQGRARGESGQILILTALSMVVLLGVAALSVDASYM